MFVPWTPTVPCMDVPASINLRKNVLPVRAEARQAEAMPDRIALRSKLLDAAVAERDKPRFRHLSRKEWDEIFDPCRSREPVYAWLLANHAKVIKARQYRNGWSGMQWSEIARIMVLEGILGSRGEPPNANSVRRVWERVVRDKEGQDARKAEGGD